MPALTSGKGIDYGWNLGEGGWKPGMDENMLRITAMLRHAWAQNRATTAALLFGYFGGMLIVAGEWARIVDGTVAVTDNAVNYVEYDPATGAVSANTDGFTAELYPMAQVAALAGNIGAVVDCRADVPGLRVEVLAAIAALANDFPAHGDGAPVDGVTGVGNTSKQYVNDVPALGEAILYLNTATIANPVWAGVMTV